MLVSESAALLSSPLAEAVREMVLFVCREMALRLSGRCWVQVACKVGDEVRFTSSSITSLVILSCGDSCDGTRSVSFKNSASLVHILLIRLMYSTCEVKGVSNDCHLRTLIFIVETLLWYGIVEQFPSVCLQAEPDGV